MRGQRRAGPAGGQGGEHLPEAEKDRFFADFPPAINRPEFYYGFVGVTLAWQFMFLLGD